MSMQRTVGEFHYYFGLPMAENVTEGDHHEAAELVDNRLGLIEEESDELLDELQMLMEEVEDPETEEDEILATSARALKEAADLVYVIVGTCVALGWDFDEAFRRVHESNMTKTGDILEGKLRKGEGYKAPDLSDLV